MNRATGDLLVLNGEEVRALLPMNDCIELMTNTMSIVSHTKAELPLRTALPVRGQNGRFGVMQGALTEPPCFGLKAISLYPDNPAIGLSSHLGVVLLVDSQNGEPMALMNASEITSLRTAAASAAATAALANEDAADLAILGTGEQAKNHLLAMKCIRRLRRIRVWGRTAVGVRSFVETCREHLPVPIEPMESAKWAVAGANLICTTTASSEPILFGDWVAEGAHINLVGSSYAQSAEVDEALVLRSRFFVDYRASALLQAGELLRAINRGSVGADHIQAEIGEVISGSAPGRRSPDEITLYKSLGIITQDLATAWELYRRAKVSRVGKWVSI